VVGNVEQTSASLHMVPCGNFSCTDLRHASRFILRSNSIYLYHAKGNCLTTIGTLLQTSIIT